MSELFDAHCHWQDPRLADHLDHWWPTVKASSLCAVVNGTHPGDWDEVAGWAERSAQVIPSFGVHPWRTGELPDDWKTKLRNYLRIFPKAGVGEIGLDKWIRDADLPRQKEVFREQWILAVEEGRPLTVHCLQAFGHLLEELKSLPKASGGFLLHAYSGPLELLEQFLSYGAHFSFSGYFLHGKKEAVRKIYQELPEDRLLVETDAPHMLPPEVFQDETLVGPEKPLHHPANLTAVLRGLAKIRGWSFAHTATITNKNASRLFGLPQDL